jgi:AbrB family looped-hinge helix DNA binding protein
MPLTLKRKIFEAGRSLRVNIPKEVVEALDVIAGDWVEFGMNDGQVILVKSKMRRR